MHNQRHPKQSFARNHRAAIRACCLALLPLLIMMTGGAVAEEAGIQSTARPFGLEPIGPVHVAGSDEASAAFLHNELPDLLTFVNDTLTEKNPVDDALYQIDPTKLDIVSDSDVRVYFLGEGAGYQNTLGLSTDGASLNGTDDSLVFPNASTTSGWYTRRQSAPLQAGDWVELGAQEAGTTLDFFLIANGARGGTTTWWTDPEMNSDGINHVVALAPPESSYLVLGFEDLYGGGDRDYNDLVFAVDIGEDNVKSLIHGDAPPLWLCALIACGMIVFWCGGRGVSAG